MSWKASSVVEERTRFVLEYAGGLSSMAELCRNYEISRETGYVWWRRYARGGLAGMRDRSRAPHEPGHRTPEQIAAMVLELRREHMRWGPRELKWVLEQAEPEMRWPAASTIGALLAREGLAMTRKKRHRVPPYTQPFAAAYLDSWKLKIVPLSNNTVSQGDEAGEEDVSPSPAPPYPLNLTKVSGVFPV